MKFTTQHDLYYQQSTNRVVNFIGRKIELKVFSYKIPGHMPGVCVLHAAVPVFPCHVQPPQGGHVTKQSSEEMDLSPNELEEIDLSLKKMEEIDLSLNNLLEMDLSLNDLREINLSLNDSNFLLYRSISTRGEASR